MIYDEGSCHNQYEDLLLLSKIDTSRMTRGTYHRANRGMVKMNYISLDQAMDGII